MAKAYVTCQECGAVVTVGTSKNRRDADRYAEYLESQGYLCEDCLAKQREEENSKAAAENSAAGLPELTGTEKQIAWAETIRAALIPRIREELIRLTKGAEYSDDVVEKLRTETMRRVEAQTDASWWIDNRASATEVVFAIGGKVQEEFERGDHTPEADEAKQEATIRPETEITEVVAEISATGSAITIRLPEKIEPFRELVKLSLGYRWDPKAMVWSRKIDKFSGPIKHRMAEAANKILAIGVPVRVFDLEVRDMALQATFQPEKERWLTRVTDGQYAGWIAIRWGREDGLYESARALPGSRYSRPSVVVPVDHYDALQDFADAHGFSVSEGAEEAMQAAKRAHDDAVIATPATAPSASDKPGAMPTPSGDIDNDLRDH